MLDIARLIYNIKMLHWISIARLIHNNKLLDQFRIARLIHNKSGVLIMLKITRRIHIIRKNIKLDKEGFTHIQAS